MTTQDRRERERTEMRERIMDAARDLMADRGYDNVTMRAVADAIEYSPTAIYYHFKDKDDLVLALCEADFSGLIAYFDSKEPPSDPVDAVRKFGRAYARFGLERPNQYRFMFMTRPKLRPENEGEAEKAPSGIRSYMLFREAVEAAIESGRFRKLPVDTVTQVLWASVHGAVSLLVTVPAERWPHAPAAADLVDQMIENSIRGFLAPEGKAGR